MESASKSQLRIPTKTTPWPTRTDNSYYFNSHWQVSDVLAGKWCTVTLYAKEFNYYDFGIWAPSTLSNSVLHDCKVFVAFSLGGLIGIPESVLFWSLAIICCVKMEGVLLGKISRTFLESSKLLIYFSMEFESLAFRVENFCKLFLWSKLPGVVSHVFPVAPPLTGPRPFLCGREIISAKCLSDSFDSHTASAIHKGHCKSWTLDSGLDHGLDCGLFFFYNNSCFMAKDTWIAKYC